MSQFEEAINGTLEVLKRRGRVSYAAITRQYGLSPDDLDALKDELIEILGAARDEAGKMLVAVEAGTSRAEGAAERRLVSVMACDLVASTPLSQRLDPEQLREVIRAYQESVEAAIERHGGHAARSTATSIRPPSSRAAPRISISSSRSASRSSGERPYCRAIAA